MENYEVNFFKALAHSVRLKIVKKLLEGETCVCELKNDVDFSQSNLSQHLKILKEAGIVNSNKKGLWVHYSVTDPSVSKVIELVEDIIKNRIKSML